MVTWNTQAMAYNPATWGDDADEFRPDRFITERGTIEVPEPHKFPVFHAGRRLCLGKRMALMSTKAMVAELVTNFDAFHCPAPGKELPQKQHLITNRSKNGMWVTVDVAGRHEDA